MHQSIVISALVVVVVSSAIAFAEDIPSSVTKLVESEQHNLDRDMVLLRQKFNHKMANGTEQPGRYAAIRGLVLHHLIAAYGIREAVIEKALSSLKEQPDQGVIDMNVHLYKAHMKAHKAIKFALDHVFKLVQNRSPTIHQENLYSMIANVQERLQKRLMSYRRARAPGKDHSKKSEHTNQITPSDDLIDLTDLNDEDHDHDNLLQHNDCDDKDQVDHGIHP